MTIGTFAVPDRFEAVAFAGNDGRCATLPQPVAEGIGIIGFVGQNFSGGRQRLQQRNGGFAVETVAAGQQETDWAAFSIDYRVDFGCAAAPTDPERLILAPFLPRALRWALMAVLSILFS